LRRVYQAQSAFDAQLVCDLLIDAGFNAIVKGGYLSGAVGELPADTLVSVVILPNQLKAGEALVTDADYHRARDIIADFENDASTVSPGSSANDAGGLVTCSACGEKSDQGFAICWNCQASL